MTKAEATFSGPFVVTGLSGAGKTVLMKLIANSERLPQLGMYNASPSHVTTHEELFRAATGWEPKVDLAEGLRRTVDHFRSAPGGS